MLFDRRSAMTFEFLAIAKWRGTHFRESDMTDSDPCNSNIPDAFVVVL